MRKDKTIYMALLALLAVFTITSCDSTENVNDTAKTEDANRLFKIADFPGSFNEGKTTRTVGTADAGKTGWTDGDTLYVKCEVYEGISSGVCTGNKKDTYVYLLTRASSAWKATLLSTNTKPLSYYQAQNVGVRVSAYYAPNYDFSADGTLTLKTGKTAGTAEYLTYTKDEAIADMGSSNLISFTRNYARIRMHAPAGMDVSLKEASNLFVPAEDATSTAGYTTTADANGNAFFYGTWTKGSSDLTFYAVAKDGDTEFYLSNTPGNVDSFNDSYSLSASSTANKGYVMDAYPTYYNSIGSGATAHPHIILTKEQMEDLLDDSYKNSYDVSLNFILCRDIDMEGYTFTYDYEYKEFEGVFDGNFHTISNYTHEMYDKDWGLFPRVQGDFGKSQSCTYGIIKNLTVTPISNTTSYGDSHGGYAGALVGYLEGGAVMNCRVQTGVGDSINYVNRNLNYNRYFGGLIGYAKDSYIIESCARCSANGSNGIIDDSHPEYFIGGLVGGGDNTYIGHCYVDANINTAQDDYKGGQGGFVGKATNGTKFEGCYAQAYLSYEKETENKLGVFGVNIDGCTFTHCYAYDLKLNSNYPFLGNTTISEGGDFVTSEDLTLVNNLNSSTPSVTDLYKNDKLKAELNKNSGFKLVDGKVRLKWE